MSILDKIMDSKGIGPRKTVLYGKEGCGKTTWASKWPSPIYIPTENGIDGVRDKEGNLLKVKAFPLCQTLSEYVEYLVAVAQEENEYETVVTDTIDWLQKLVWKEVSNDKKVESIEEIGYAKGYQFAMRYWDQIIDIWDSLISKGKHVLLLSHHAITHIASPEGDPYDAYDIAVHPKTIAPRIRQWANEVLFVHDQVMTKTQQESFDKNKMDKKVAVNSITTLKTVGKPAYHAKNKLGLPESMEFDFETYKQYL